MTWCTSHHQSSKPLASSSYPAWETHNQPYRILKWLEPPHERTMLWALHVELQFYTHFQKSVVFVWKITFKNFLHQCSDTSLDINAASLSKWRTWQSLVTADVHHGGPDKKATTKGTQLKQPQDAVCVQVHTAQHISQALVRDVPDRKPFLKDQWSTLSENIPPIHGVFPKHPSRKILMRWLKPEAIPPAGTRPLQRGTELMLLWKYYKTLEGTIKCSL